MTSISLRFNGINENSFKHIIRPLSRVATADS